MHYLFPTNERLLSERDTFLTPELTILRLENVKGTLADFLLFSLSSLGLLAAITYCGVFIGVFIVLIVQIIFIFKWMNP